MPTLVQSKVVDEPTNQTSIVASFDTLPTPGNLVLAFAGSSHGGAVAGSFLHNQTGQQPRHISMRFGWCNIVEGSVGSYTYTWINTQNWTGSIILLEWSGAANRIDLDWAQDGPLTFSGGTSRNGPIVGGETGATVVGHIQGSAGVGNINASLNGYADIASVTVGSGRSYFVTARNVGTPWDGLPPGWSAVSGGVTSARLTTILIHPAVSATPPTTFDGNNHFWADGRPVNRAAA